MSDMCQRSPSEIMNPPSEWKSLESCMSIGMLLHNSLFCNPLLYWGIKQYNSKYILAKFGINKFLDVFVAEL